MIANRTCPSKAELLDFAAGRLPHDRFSSLLSHIDDCDRCQQATEQSLESEQSIGSDDSFTALLRDPEGDCPIIAEVDCQTAVFRAAAGANRQYDSLIPPIEHLGPYRLLRPIGQGGMGSVYLAEHVRLRKKYAVKLLPRDKRFDHDWRSRFEREMQAVASLDHPNIVTATDAGDVDGWHYMVMEYLDGVDLATLSRRCGPIDIAEVAAVGHRLCHALAAVHNAGLVHRDIKPSNAVLTKAGIVKLLDLGLVQDIRATDDQVRLTTVGHMMGTLAFAAPEQLTQEGQVDFRADLYGLGATLFQLASGQPAHRCDRGIAPLVIEKTSSPAPSLRTVREEVPESIDRLISRLLERDPSDRPQRADEVAAELEPLAAPSLKRLAKKAIRITDGLPTASPGYGIAGVADSTTSAPPRRPRTWLTAAVAAFFAFIAGFVFYVQTDRGTLVIESEVDGLTVSIRQAGQSVDSIELSQGETQTTLRSGNYEIALDTETDNAIVSDSAVLIRRGEQTVVRIRNQLKDTTIGQSSEKQFKGKPLAYYLDTLRTERDVKTLGDAMIAIASLADTDDVALAEALLIPARKYGGWASGDVGDYYQRPSRKFMHDFSEAYQRLVPQPGIAAIIKELADGSSRSRAACLWQLQTFQQQSAAGDLQSGADNGLVGWARDDANQVEAKRLHDVLRKLLRGPKIVDPPQMRNQGLSHEACQEVSMSLALALERDLSDEPGLANYLENELSNVEESVIPLEVRIDRILDPDTKQISSPAAPLSPINLVAADKLGLKIPPALVTSAVLFHSYKQSQLYRDERNEHFQRKLQAEPVRFADEILVWSAAQKLPPIYEINKNDGFWTNLFSHVAKNTSQPLLAVRVLVGLSGEQRIGGSMGGRGGMGGGGGSSVRLRPELDSLVNNAIREAEERLFENLQSVDSLPEIDADDLRNSAKELIEPKSTSRRVGGLGALGSGSIKRSESKPDPAADWDRDGEVSVAELAWHRQKQQWKKSWIGSEKTFKPTSPGGGGMF